MAERRSQDYGDPVDQQYPPQERGIRYSNNDTLGDDQGEITPPLAQDMSSDPYQSSPQGTLQNDADNSGEQSSGRFGRMRGLFKKSSKKDKDAGKNNESVEDIEEKAEKKKFFSRKKKDKSQPLEGNIAPSFEPDANPTDEDDRRPPQFTYEEDADQIPYDDPPYTINQTPVDMPYYPPPLSRSQRMRNSMRGMVKSAPREPIVQGPDVAVLKPPPPKSLFRSSNVLSAVLIAGIVIGIVMTALGSTDRTLYYIGPVFLGLSLFALIAKVFLTLLYEEEPFPVLKPMVQKMQAKVTSKVRGPPPPPPPSAMDLVTAQAAYENRGLNRSHEVIAMGQLPGQRVVYEPELDTGLRTATRQEPDFADISAIESPPGGGYNGMTRHSGERRDYDADDTRRSGEEGDFSHGMGHSTDPIQIPSEERGDKDKKCVIS